jgi:hypothetical protein
MVDILIQNIIQKGRREKHKEKGTPKGRVAKTKRRGEIKGQAERGPS